MTATSLLSRRSLRPCGAALLIGLASVQAPAQTSNLYMGAYQEDPRSNPEDPTAGLLYLNLPAGDQAFKGLMDFTFVGCQTKSVAEIQGEKSNGSLKGKWSGKLDHTSQSGSYTGQYSKEGNSYAGTYTVDKGKQLVTVPNCIRYHIAPNGTWRIFALSETFSEASSHQPISVADGIARWAIPPGAAMASVSLVDKALATSGAKNAVLYQQMIPATLKQFRLPAKYAKSGKTYIASVLASNGRELVYFSSTEFPKSAATAPTPTIHLGNPAASTEGSNSSAPHTMGSTKPDPQPANDQPNVCAGLYQGHYDGALAGIMSVQVGEQSENLSGFAATGGYNGSMRFEDQARKTEMQGVKRFQFVTGSAGKACHYSFSGTWAAPIHSVDPKRTQRMYFSGRADGQNMRGEYRFDKNVNSRPMGTFTLRKVN